MVWDVNQGPLLPGAPGFAGVGRYSGRGYLGGAPLAAGGWYSDGASLVDLIRVLCRSSLVVPLGVTSQLWDPQWKNLNGSPAAGWAYGLGWYLRGNWVAWAGGAEGSTATVMHNRFYDYTIVHLTNVLGNGLAQFAAVPMLPASGWGSSLVGQILPCVDDPATMGNGCGNSAEAY